MHSNSILITGSATRIGNYILKRFCEKGYSCHVHYNSNKEQALLLLNQLNAINPKASHGAIQADLSTSQGVYDLNSYIAQVKPSCLVQNASSFRFDTLDSCCDSTLDFQLNTNFIAPLKTSLEYSKIMSKANLKGSIVLMLDQKVINLNKDYVSYTLSKLALFSSLKFLAQISAPFVRVNAVLPGLTLISGDMSEQEFEAARLLAALGSSNTQEDLFNAVLFFESNSAISGQFLAVDGGQSLIPSDRDVAFKVKK